MSYARDYQMKGGPNSLNNLYPLNQNSMSNHYRNRAGTFSMEHGTLYMFPSEVSGNVQRSYFEHMRTDSAPSMKRRKHSSSSWESYCSVPSSRDSFPARFNAPASTSASCKRDRSQREDDELVFLSRDEIERLSPSRRDGIDALRETHLRYSYCAFLQDLGQRLELPQTTIGTAMVLCHRFFVRRSHAFHDRFLIATASLFLAAKSEETACPLNSVLLLSCEIYHKQDISFLSYLLPVDWFEQYRERVTEAEQLILTTLNFELNVQHPFAPLMSVFNKLGLSQSMLLNVALNLISEGQEQPLLQPVDLRNPVCGIRCILYFGIVSIHASKKLGTLFFRVAAFIIGFGAPFGFSLIPIRLLPEQLISLRSSLIWTLCLTIICGKIFKQHHLSSMM